MIDPATEERLREAAASSAMEAGEFSFRNAPKPPARTTSTLGWIRYSWNLPKRRCAKCARKVTTGVIRSNMRGRERDEAFRVLCSSCYSEIMSTPTPEEWR